MFSFVVKHFGFLKAVPLLPHLFDSQLLLWTLITKPQVLNYLDKIEAEVLNWEGTTKSIHKYGGLQFNFKGREIGHIHSNGLLDVRLSRKIKQQLIGDRRVVNHHVFANSGWVSFYIRDKNDSEYAMVLLRMGYKLMLNKVEVASF